MARLGSATLYVNEGGMSVTSHTIRNAENCPVFIGCRCVGEVGANPEVSFGFGNGGSGGLVLDRKDDGRPHLYLDIVHVYLYMYSTQQGSG